MFTGTGRTAEVNFRVTSKFGRVQVLTRKLTGLFVKQLLTCHTLNNTRQRLLCGKTKTYKANGILFCKLFTLVDCGFHGKEIFPPRVDVLQVNSNLL